MPQNLQRIPDRIFCECSSLEELQFPPLVQEIGELAFYNCTRLQSIDLPEIIVLIDCSSFSYCTALVTVKIRSSSLSNLRIKTNIFQGCASLSTIMYILGFGPTLWKSMNYNPIIVGLDGTNNNADKKEFGRDFIFKFFKKYHTHILDLASLYLSNDE